MQDPLSPSLRRSSGRKRWFLVFAVLLVGSALLAGAIPETRHGLLRGAGWMLVASDAEQPADIVVVAVDALGAGVLEAADIVHRGIAPRVALFATPPTRVGLEFLRRDVPYFDQAAVSVQQLHNLGITAVEQIPRPVSGTSDEAEALSDWCQRNGLRRVIVVTSADHSRRARRALHRQLDGRLARVTVRYSPYSVFDPDRWWQTRDGVRTELVESEKLLLDVLLHPLY